jgi:hypothetical protein
MAARTSNGETRWARAVQQARRLAAAGVVGGDVAIATTADGLVEGPSSDLALLETALDRLQPAGGEAAAWPRVADAGRVHVVTDGAIRRNWSAAAGPGRADVVSVHSVFEPAPNVAVVAFDARPASAGEAAGAAYIQIANYAPEAQTVRASVTRGTSVVWTERIEMAAGEAISHLVPLPPDGGARLLARVEAADDSLAEDNEAVAWIEGAEPIDVTVVSEAPGALRTLLQSDRSVRAMFVAPADYRPAREGVVIFDGWLPAAAPEQPALAIAPPASSWLGDRGDEERTPRWLTSAAHAVVAGVDPLTVDVRRAVPLVHPGLVPIARSEGGTTLVAIADSRTRRMVVWSFAVGDTNLKTAPGFPVLVGNTLEWLGRPSYGVMRRPSRVRLPESTTRVVSPTGQPVALVRAAGTVLAPLWRPGLYLVDTAGALGVVGVNVGDPEVSNLSRTTLDNAEGVTAVVAGVAGWPWWMWAVVAALGLTAAEWWTWQRRVTV